MKRVINYVSVMAQRQTFAEATMSLQGMAAYGVFHSTKQTYQKTERPSTALKELSDMLRQNGVEKIGVEWKSCGSLARGLIYAHNESDPEYLFFHQVHLKAQMGGIRAIPLEDNEGARSLSYLHVLARRLRVEWNGESNPLGLIQDTANQSVLIDLLSLSQGRMREINGRFLAYALHRSIWDMDIDGRKAFPGEIEGAVSFARSKLMASTAIENGIENLVVGASHAMDLGLFGAQVMPVMQSVVLAGKGPGRFTLILSAEVQEGVEVERRGASKRAHQCADHRLLLESIL